MKTSSPYVNIKCKKPYLLIILRDFSQPLVILFQTIHYVLLKIRSLIFSDIHMYINEIIITVGYCIFVLF